MEYNDSIFFVLWSCLARQYMYLILLYTQVIYTYIEMVYQSFCRLKEIEGWRVLCIKIINTA